MLRIGSEITSAFASAPRLTADLASAEARYGNKSGPTVSHTLVCIGFLANLWKLFWNGPSGIKSRRLSEVTSWHVLL